MNKLASLLIRLDRYGRAAENVALVTLLTSMMLIAVGQIVLRQVFSTGIIWADELVKIIVLWLAMFGAVAAARDNRHIRIDALSHLLPAAVIRYTRVVVDLFAAVVCAVVAWQAFRYMQLEIEFQDTVLVDTPAWLAHADYSCRVCADELPLCCRCRCAHCQYQAARSQGRHAVIVVSIVLILLAILGAPLFAVIATSAMLGFQRDDVDLMNMAIEIQSIGSLPFLAAIPLFTFAGYVLSESNAPQRLVRMTGALIGWMPGGLAVVCIAACAFFTAFTGASGVTIIALGAILYPALQQDGYTDRFTLGLVTSSGGSLGLLFAPSLPLILYGVVAEISIDDLFLAGILPGFLMLGVMGAYSFWVNRHVRRKISEFSWREVAAATRETIWEIPLPIVVLGGIYSGYFAVSEAAAVTALYVLIVEVLIHREIKLRDLPGIMRNSMVLVGGILIILGVSLASTNYMISARRAADAARIRRWHRLQPNLVPALAAGVPAGSRRDTGHFFGDRAGGAAGTADRGGLRHSPGTPRYRVPRGHGAGIFDASRWSQSIHIELPI